jgi:hypothetical protein
MSSTAVSRRRFARRIAFGAVLALVGSVGTFEGMRAYRIWSASRRLPAELPKQPIPPAPEPPDPIHLNTVPLPPRDRQHLLDGDFKVVLRVGDLAGSCWDVFASSFLTFSGAPASKELVKLADPGQDFDATDVTIREGLPSRRLVFAGLGPGECFIYYERGGAHATTCLAIIEYEQKKTIWVGESNRKARNFKELRENFARGFFGDTYGPIC